MGTLRRTLVPVLVAASAMLAAASASAAPADVTILTRDAPAATLALTAGEPSELLLDVSLSAPGADWSRHGAEAAVVSVAVDGRHLTDVLAFGPDLVPRTLALGRIGPGDHEVSLRIAGDRTRPAVTEAWVSNPVPRLVPIDGSTASVVVRHAPLIFGRTSIFTGGRFQNARTDTPLVGWHEVRPGTVPGRRLIEYSMIWSGEDGGTAPSALMAVWGRTADIEWTYRVEVDAGGDRVPGTAFFHGLDHAARPFGGTFDADHPRLRTCTRHNTLCSASAAPMPFFLGHEQTRPAGRAREAVMDLNPWTYRVMADEMLREGRLEATPDPTTTAVGDQRTYLWVEVDKRTAAASGPGAVGLAVDVRLRGRPDVHRSDHARPSLSIVRDGAVATTVELPAGVTAADIVEVAVRRVVIGVDPGAPVEVRGVTRGFMLDAAFVPQPSFLTWSGPPITLSAAEPVAAVLRTG